MRLFSPYITLSLSCLFFAPGCDSDSSAPVAPQFSVSTFTFSNYGVIDRDNIVKLSATYSGPAGKGQFAGEVSRSPDMSNSVRRTKWIDAFQPVVYSITVPVDSFAFGAFYYRLGRSFETATGYSQIEWSDSIVRFERVAPAPIENLTYTIRPGGIIDFNFTQVERRAEIVVIRDGVVVARLGSAAVAFSDSAYDVREDEHTWTFRTCTYTCERGVSVTVSGLGVEAPIASGAKDGTGVVRISWAHDGQNITRFIVNNNSPTGYAGTTVAPTLRFLRDSTYSIRSDSVQWTVGACSSVGCVWSASLYVGGLMVEPATNLAVASNTDTGVTLQWQDNSDNETGFGIFRRFGGSNTIIAQVGAGVTTYEDNTVQPGVEYSYSVAAMQQTRTSLPTPELRVIAGGASLTAPTVDTIFSRLGDTRYFTVVARLNPNGLATTLHVDWSSDPALTTFQSTSNVSAGSSARVVQRESPAITPTANGTYYYRVVASNSAGTTVTPIQRMEFRPPAPVDGMTVTIEPDGLARINWTRASANVSFWRITRKRTGAESPESVVDITRRAARVAYDNTYSVQHDDYIWGVRACNGVGCSQVRGQQVTGVALQKPGYLKVVGNTAAGIRLTWTDGSTYETGFVLERQRVGIPDWTAFSLPANTTSFYDTTRTSGLTYNYRVRARNAIGLSEYSRIVTATAN